MLNSNQRPVTDWLTDLIMRIFVQNECATVHALFVLAAPKEAYRHKERIHVWERCSSDLWRVFSRWVIVCHKKADYNEKQNVTLDFFLSTTHEYRLRIDEEKEEHLTFLMHYSSIRCLHVLDSCCHWFPQFYYRCFTASNNFNNRNCEYSQLTRRIHTSFVFNLNY